MTHSHQAITRARIVTEARSWIGTPYHHQASAKGIGTDCLGLVRGIYRELYGHEAAVTPNYSRDWAEASGRETLLEAARLHLIEIPKADANCGDILLFRWHTRTVVKHVGILLARPRLLHAYEDAPVHMMKMTPWWWRHTAAAFRFPDVID